MEYKIRENAEKNGHLSLDARTNPFLSELISVILAQELTYSLGEKREPLLFSQLLHSNKDY